MIAPASASIKSKCVSPKMRRTGMARRVLDTPTQTAEAAAVLGEAHSPEVRLRMTKGLDAWPGQQNPPPKTGSMAQAGFGGRNRHEKSVIFSGKLRRYG